MVARLDAGTQSDETSCAPNSAKTIPQECQRQPQTHAYHPPTDTPTHPLAHPSFKLSMVAHHLFLKRCETNSERWTIYIGKMSIWGDMVLVKKTKNACKYEQVLVLNAYNMLQQ